eukprot:PhM_4_TR10837/c0_g1_i1/m.83036
MTSTSLKQKYSTKEVMASTVPSTSVDEFKDYDWGTMCVVATSALASINVPLMRLTLHVATHADPTHMKEVVLEMTEDELAQWIQELTPVHAELMQSINNK